MHNFLHHSYVWQQGTFNLRWQSFLRDRRALDATSGSGVACGILNLLQPQWLSALSTTSSAIWDVAKIRLSALSILFFVNRQCDFQSAA